MVDQQQLGNLTPKFGFERLTKEQRADCAHGAAVLVESKEVQLLFENLFAGLFTGMQHLQSPADADKIFYQIKAVTNLKNQLEALANERDYRTGRAGG